MAKKAIAKKAAVKKDTGSGGTKRLKVPMHSVVHFVRMLHDEKHAAKFIKAARNSKAMVELHPSTVNFVKKYVANNNLHAAMASNVVDPCPGDPFGCHFRD
jgi:hypothetical protein